MDLIIYVIKKIYVFLYIFGALIITYSGIEPPVICIIFMLMFFDSITGYVMAKSLGIFSKKKFRWKLFIKVLMLSSLILLGILMTIGFGETSSLWKYVGSSVFGLFGVQEAISSMENIQIARTGNKDIKKIDIYGFFVEKLRGYVYNKLEEIDKKITE